MELSFSLSEDTRIKLVKTNMHKSQHVREMLIIKNIFAPLFDVHNSSSFVMEEVMWLNGEMLTSTQQIKLNHRNDVQ